MKSDTTWLIKLAHIFYARPLIRRRRLSLVNNTAADLNKGPYLLISNHVGIMDPVIISSLFPRERTVRWVTGAYLFKSRFLKHIFSHHLKCIPKQQGKSDFSTVRTMQRELKNGNIVGIYPEGTRTWDGDTISMNYLPVAKMMKTFRVPVIVANLEGGFANQPRWADKIRKGPVTVNIKRLFTPDEIAALDLGELSRDVQSFLFFSNDAWKNNENYRYESNERAEGIQRLFYMCPVCHGIETIKTKGNTIRCSNCGATAELDSMDNIVSDTIEFTKIPQWHNWEKNTLSEIKAFAPQHGVLFQRGNSDNNGTLEAISKDITVSLENNIINVKCNDSGRKFEMPLENITSLILNAKQTIELFCNEVLYRIRLTPDASSLKYQEYYQVFTEKNNVHSRLP